MTSLISLNSKLAYILLVCNHPILSLTGINGLISLIIARILIIYEVIGLKYHLIKTKSCLWKILEFYETN